MEPEIFLREPTSIRPSIKNLVFYSEQTPVIIHLRIYCASEITDGAEETFHELTSQPVNEYLNYETAECFISSYKTAPWFIYCKENYLS